MRSHENWRMMSENLTLGDHVGVFGRRWCFGNNRIKRGQKEHNWHVTVTWETSVKTERISASWIATSEDFKNLLFFQR